MKPISINSILFLALFTVSASAQNIKFEHLNTQEGLSQSNVNCIFQDSRGFIWVGTRYGLNRYDGYKFIVYNNDPNNSLSISDDFVADVTEDMNGDLWIATKNGLNKFNRKTGIFKRYLHNENDANTLSGNVLNKLAFDKDGNLWIATQLSGMDCLNIKQGHFQHFFHSDNDTNSLSDNRVRTVFIDSQNKIWIGTFAGGLNCYNKKSKVFQKFFNRNSRTHRMIGLNIPVIFEDNDNKLWVGTQDDGLFLLDAKLKSFYSFKAFTKAKEARGATIFSIGDDNKGNLWIGTENEGLIIMDKRTKKITHYLHDGADKYSINGNSIYSICRDNLNNMWLGIFSAGISLYKISTSNFVHYRHTSSPSSLSNNFVLDIFEDSKKNVWIATDGGGVNVKTPASDTFIHLVQGAKVNQGLSGNYDLVVREMKNGNIWIGTWGGGITIFNPVSKTYSYLKNNPKNANSISSNNIFAITQTRDGKVWIGTANAGLNCYDEKTKQITRYSHSDYNPASISSNFILSLLEDNNGNLWIGTYDNGLSYFDRSIGTFSHYLSDGAGQSISNNSITDIFKDSKGNLWVSTFYGLNKLDILTNHLKIYTADSGLPGNIIYAVREDNQGRLWISTNKGISAYNPLSEQFKNFSTENGLQEDEFKPHSALKSVNGHLYFGGINGFNEFDPATIDERVRFSPIVISGFSISNQSVDSGNDRPRSLLPNDFSEIKSVTLTYKQTFISCEFAALDFVTAGKKKYAYILEGFDKDWNYVGSRNSAFYTNIPPGHYQFKIKYQNSYGNWSPVYSKFEVTIVPPFWLTWWFKTLAALIITAAIYCVIKFRTNADKKQKIKLERQVQAKTWEVIAQKDALEIQQREINRKNKSLEDLLVEKDNLIVEKEWLLREIHHRVKNNLQVIMSLLNIQSSYLEDEETLSALSESKHRIFAISLIHEKLYQSNNVSRVNVKPYIHELVSYLSDSFNINHTVTFDMDLMSFELDATEAVPVGLILNEAITNAIKYAFPNGRNGVIKICVEKTFVGNVSLIIQDDGIGLSESSKYKTVSLGFALMKGLAKQLGGDIKIENGKGVRILVEFVTNTI